MILKKVKETKIVKVKKVITRNETYVESLIRIKGEINKLLNLTGTDCVALLKGEGCQGCPLGTMEPLGDKFCLSGRIEHLMNEAIQKAEKDGV